MTQLETMYTQVVGKPSTTTSREFRIGDATLYVASTTLFPAAPNKVTITDASETNLVTLWYTAKTATTLTVSTVVECYPPTATAAVFAIGSTAHRPFCKSDVDALSGNITQLNANKAELTHATTHTLNGSDPITIHPSQVVGNGATLDVSVIPAAGMLKTVTVANDTARYALTTATVQKGDSVRVTATNKLYMIVDDAKLNVAAGYLEYTADTVPHAGKHLTGGSDAIPKATTSADGLMPKEALAKTNLISHFGTCTTAATTAAKTATLTGFNLVTGARVIVGFTVSNTAASPTLNINSTGAKPITWMGEPISPDILRAGTTFELVYDGTNYRIVGDVTRTKKKNVHAVLINENDSNSITRVTHVGASTGMDSAAREAELRKHIRHCVYKAARAEFYVDEDDWSKKLDGTSSGVENGVALDGNFGVEQDHMWYKITPYGSNIYLWEHTWENPYDDTWTPCHLYKDGTIREHDYYSVFEGVRDSNYHGKDTLRSIYGTTAGENGTFDYRPYTGTDVTNETLYQKAHNTGEAEGLTGDDNTYSTVPIPIRMMRLCLLVWRYGTTNFQRDVARGIVDDADSVIGRRPTGFGISLTGGNTQGTPAASQAYTENTAAVTAGASNEYGNIWEQMCDAVYDGWDRFAYAPHGGDHLNITTVTASNWDSKIPATYKIVHGIAKSGGFVTRMLMDNGVPMLPKNTGATDATHYADNYYHNNSDTEANHAPRCCLVGGSWGHAGHAGPFYLNLTGAAANSYSLIGARLHAYSLT